MCDILSNQGMQIKTTLRFHLTPIGMTNIYKFYWQEANYSWLLGYTTLILVLGRQKQVNFWVGSQPGLYSQFQASLGSAVRHCLNKKKIRVQTRTFTMAECGFLKSLETDLPCHFVVPALGLFSSSLYPTRDICSSTFTAANPQCLGNSAASIPIPDEQCKYTMKKTLSYKE